MTDAGQPKAAVADRFWLDTDGAEERIRDLRPAIGEVYAAGLLDLVKSGFAVFQGVMSQELCDAATADYRRFLQAQKHYADQYVDRFGRHNRLVNFHRTSEAALKLGASPFLMKFLDLVFGKKAGIYTSLTFEYGTEQPIHRDSPFFHTFPVNYFVGAWIALEDIAPDAGPLMYVPGGHRVTIDQHAIYKSVSENAPGSDRAALIMRALDIYNGDTILASSAIAPPKVALLRKGDLAVWHAMLPHGGAPALDKTKTRRSIVFHCAPEAMQVYQQDVFFTYESAAAPPPRYGFGTFGDRTYSLVGDTAFQ